MGPHLSFISPPFLASAFWRAVPSTGAKRLASIRRFVLRGPHWYVERVILLLLAGCGVLPGAWTTTAGGAGGVAAILLFPGIPEGWVGMGDDDRIQNQRHLGVRVFGRHRLHACAGI